MWGFARLVGRRERAGAKGSRCWRVREEVALVSERRLCWEVWARRAGLPVVGRRAVVWNGSWGGRGGMVGGGWGDCEVVSVHQLRRGWCESGKGLLFARLGMSGQRQGVKVRYYLTVDRLTVRAIATRTSWEHGTWW